MVGNRNGDVVRINTSGDAELIWPGNGAGKPDGLGAFSCLNDDGQGHLFVRGDTGDGSQSVIRMIHPSGLELLPVAIGLSQCFGGFQFSDDGRELLISDDHNILLIKSPDERTIADHLLSPKRSVLQLSQTTRTMPPSHRHSYQEK